MVQCFAPYLFRVRLETCARHIHHFVWVPRCFTKYFHLKKLPAGVQIHVLVQGGNFVTGRRIKNSGLDVSQGQK
jgi:hypothetical protein